MKLLLGGPITGKCLRKQCRTKWGSASAQWSSLYTWRSYVARLGWKRIILLGCTGWCKSSRGACHFVAFVVFRLKLITCTGDLFFSCNNWKDKIRNFVIKIILVERQKMSTLNECYNLPFFKLHFFCLIVIVSVCISSEIICMLTDFRSAGLWSVCFKMHSFREKNLKNAMFLRKHYLITFLARLLCRCE